MQSPFSIEIFFRFLSSETVKVIYSPYSGQWKNKNSLEVNYTSKEVQNLLKKLRVVQLYLNEEKSVIILLEDIRLLKQPLNDGSVSISKMVFFYLDRLSW